MTTLDGNGVILLGFQVDSVLCDANRWRGFENGPEHDRCTVAHSTDDSAHVIALGDDAYKAHISSTKGSTGHMLGAAGAVEAVAAVLALKNGVVPPTANLDEIDPECDLDYTPNVPVKADLTIALSDSLGFGGHNGCVAFRKFRG